MLKVRRKRPTREESRAETVEDLLNSARAVFARNGFQGASVDLIAENAGYSKGAFYSNFESKEALFLMLLERHKRGEIRDLERLLADTPTIPQILERVGTYYAALEDDLDWGLLSAEFHIQAIRDPGVAESVRSLYRSHRAALGILITKLYSKARRALPMPAEDLAALFIGLAIGLSLERAADKPSLKRGIVGDSILLVLERFLAEGR